jgi:hypothetical protein
LIHRSVPAAFKPVATLLLTVRKGAYGMSTKDEQCIYCGRTKDETGRWAVIITGCDHKFPKAVKKTICPSCSIEKFPQHYGNTPRHGVWSRLKYQWMNIRSS